MKSTIKALSLILIFSISVSSTIAKPGDFAIVKERVVAELLKTPVDDNEVETIFKVMNEDGSFQGFNWD